MNYGLHSYHSIFARWDKKGTLALCKLFYNIKESIRDFTKRFRQVVQQVESYSMDKVLQHFRRSFRLSTPFFQSLSLDPPATMEELYRQANKYSMLEDNILAATQTVMITNQPAKGNKSSGKKLFESKEGQGKDRKRSP